MQLRGELAQLAGRAPPATSCTSRAPFLGLSVTVLLTDVCRRGCSEVTADPHVGGLHWGLPVFFMPGGPARFLFKRGSTGAARAGTGWPTR